MEYLPELWQGFLNTLMLSAAGFTGALIIGIVACALSIQPVRWLRRIWHCLYRPHPCHAFACATYFWYFGLPRLGILLPEMVIGIIALSLNSGAYVAEIIRSGILSIPRGQFEAALSSGFTYLQRMRLVVLPQAVRPTISPMIGQAIVLVKNSRLFR
ncbi:amino acid ABC transporter permease [Brucella anthropi]